MKANHSLFDHHHQYQKPVELDDRIQEIKQQIRQKSHQIYFKKIRDQFLQGEKKYMLNHELNLNQEMLPENKYNIVLNKSIQLYPINGTLESSQSSTSLIPNFDSFETFHSLTGLANLYNWLHNRIYTAQTNNFIHHLMKKVLEEIQSKVIFIEGTYSNDFLNLIEKHSIKFNEECGILFMQIIVYRELQNILRQSQQEIQVLSFYRTKLTQICQESKVVDMHILNMLGIYRKAIQL